MVQLRGSLHEHFVPPRGKRSWEKHANEFWKVIQKRKLDFVAVATHATMGSELSPREVYEYLEKTMPKDLREKGFKLIPAAEYESVEEIHAIAMHPDKDVAFDADLIKRTPNMHLRKMAKTLRSRGFTVSLAHPDVPWGAHYMSLKRGGDADKIRADLVGIIRDNGLGVESFHGMSDVVGGAIDNVTRVTGSIPLIDRVRDMLVTVPHQDLLDAARFHSAGTDGHALANIGKTRMVIKSNKPIKELSTEELLGLFDKKNMDVYHETGGRLMSTVAFIRAGMLEGGYIDKEHKLGAVGRWLRKVTPSRRPHIHRNNFTLAAEGIRLQNGQGGTVTARAAKGANAGRVYRHAIGARRRLYGYPYIGRIKSREGTTYWHSAKSATRKGPDEVLEDSLRVLQDTQG